jgi:hypothetical protein
MTSVEKLLSVGSEALAPQLVGMPTWLSDYRLGAELFQMLQKKNGFYAFEAALHVFPLTGDPGSGLEAWNAASLWRTGYKDLAEGLLFFAEDILQDQFCLSIERDGVMRFHAETGKTAFMPEEERVQYSAMTGQSLYYMGEMDLKHTGWGATQVRVHLDRLAEMEYLIVHHGGRGQMFLYEYDASLAGSEGQLAGSKRPQNGGLAEGWRPAETRMNKGPNGVFVENSENRIATGA